MSNPFIRFLFLLVCIWLIGAAMWGLHWLMDHDCKWTGALVISALVALFFTAISGGGRRDRRR